MVGWANGSGQFIRQKCGSLKLGTSEERMSKIECGGEWFFLISGFSAGSLGRWRFNLIDRIFSDDLSGAGVI